MYVENVFNILLIYNWKTCTISSSKFHPFTSDKENEVITALELKTFNFGKVLLIPTDDEPLLVCFSRDDSGYEDKPTSITPVTEHLLVNSDLEFGTIALSGLVQLAKKVRLLDTVELVQSCNNFVEKTYFALLRGDRDFYQSEVLDRCKNLVLGLKQCSYHSIIQGAIND